METSKRPSNGESEREDEATSTETVADISNAESGSLTSRKGPAPSPDGATDEPEELKKADPV